MATARAKGRGYEIRVYCGVDANYRRLDKARMWIPEKDMSPLQIRKELERQKILFEEEVRRGNVYDARMSFRQLVEVWLKDYAKKQLAPKTYARYVELLERIYPAIGHMKIKDITPIHLNRFYDNLSEPGLKRNNKNGQVIGDGRLSPKTILDHHRLISKILASAVKWGLLGSNAASRANPPKQPYREMNYLDEEKIKLVIEKLKEEPVQNRTMILLLIHLGMRRGELLGLEWKDIDLEYGSLRIARTSQYVSGEVITKEPKTKNSIRTLSISEGLCQLLRDYKTWQDETRKEWKQQYQKTDRLFTQGDGKVYYPDCLTQWFSSFIQRIGLSHVSLHSLRHSNATLMIAGDVDIATVSRRLGHSNTSVTLNIYTHALKSRDRLAAERLESILS